MAIMPSSQCGTPHSAVDCEFKAIKMKELTQPLASDGHRIRERSMVRTLSEAESNNINLQWSTSSQPKCSQELMR